MRKGGVRGAMLLAVPLCMPSVFGGEAMPVSTGYSRISVAVASASELRDRDVVKQSWDYSCGAAALATLLTFEYGYRIGEREILELALESVGGESSANKRKQGLSLRDLRDVARQLGFKAAGFYVGTKQIGDIRGPVIVFVRPQGVEHFSVLKHVVDGRVSLADQSSGNMTLAVDEFNEIWAVDGKGVILAVEPLQETTNKPAKLSGHEDAHLPDPGAVRRSVVPLQPVKARGFGPSLVR